MLKQKEMPAVGEKIAVIKTDKGDIKVRLFPEEAPKAVENFVTHAENGYYDGLIFHRVIKDFMIQVTPRVPERAARAFGASRLLMNFQASCTISEARFPWLMQAPIQTAVSSL